jgi:hypothetical protein
VLATDAELPIEMGEGRAKKGREEPVAVTGPCAKAEFAPGRATLVSVSGSRPVEPLSIIVPSTIAL